MLPLVWSKTKWLSQTECSRRKSYMNRTIFGCWQRNMQIAIDQISWLFQVPPFLTHTSTLLQCLHEERIVRSPSSWVRGPQCKIGVLMMQDLFRNFIFWSERYQGLPGKTGCWWFRHSDISDGHWFVERKSIHHYKEVFTWCNGPFFFIQTKIHFFFCNSRSGTLGTK